MFVICNFVNGIYSAGVCQKFKQHAQNGQKFLAQGNTLGGIVINK